MKKSNVLFICFHNSARSQNAEAWLKCVCGEFFNTESGELEEGIDISSATTQTVFDAWRSGNMFAYVVRVCSEAEAERRSCPIFAGSTIRLSWPFDDPSTVRGSQGARLEQTRLVRDAIKKKIEEWCESVCTVSV